LSLFPFFFAGLWLTVTTMLGFLSGWFSLAPQYPDRDETALLTLRSQSGMMGLGVSMSGILILSACPSGLRVAIWRVFGPFCRPFFVPWDDIKVQPRRQFFQKMARLGFGRPEAGVLSIDARAWERLATQAGLSQGDPRTLPPVSDGQLARAFAVQWLVITAGAAAFYYLVPRLMGGDAANGPPLAVCFLFPGIFFGVGQIIRYARQRGR
jgi:hypothetical protein